MRTAPPARRRAIGNAPRAIDNKDVEAVIVKTLADAAH